jgi:hypothetical protein
MRDFSHALAFMANAYEGGDQSKVIYKLISDTPDANSQDWKRYVDANCKMTHAKLHEENDVCVARMNFYKNWWRNVCFLMKFSLLRMSTHPLQRICQCGDAPR